MDIIVRSDTKLDVISVVIDIKDSELSFNLEGLLDTIKGTFSESIKNDIETMGISGGYDHNSKNLIQYFAKFICLHLNLSKQ
jgi:hypothetical protein